MIDYVYFQKSVSNLNLFEIKRFISYRKSLLMLLFWFCWSISGMTDLDEKKNSSKELQASFSAYGWCQGSPVQLIHVCDLPGPEL